MGKKIMIPEEISESQQNENPSSQEAFNTLGEFLGEAKAPPPPSNLGPPPTEIVSDTYSHGLDEAATLLLKQLDPSIRDFAMELADLTLKVPRWQLVLGSVLAQFEAGTLQAPSIPPGWSTVEVAVGSSTCAHCKKSFIPQRFGQRYCSNLCGNLVRKKEIMEINRQKEVERRMRKQIEEVELRGELSA